MNKQPEQTARTRRRLMDSFWNLYCQEGMEQITVGAVARKAGLNRGTFYEYFSDVHDVLDQIEDEFIGRLEQGIKSMTAGDSSHEAPLFSQQSTLLLKALVGDGLVLMGERGDPRFVAKLRRAIAPLFLEIIGMPEDDQRAAYLVSFISNGLMGMLLQWDESGRSISSDQLFSLGQTFVANTISSITDQQHGS